MGEDNLKQTTQRPRELVPVVPQWCDYHSYTPLQKIFFVGVIRAILTLTAFALCVAYLSVYDTTSGTKVILAGLIVCSLIHFFVSLYFIYAGQSGNPRRMKLWFSLDMTFSGIFVILIIALLCVIPPTKLNIALGFKLMIISIFLCYIFSRRYMGFLDQPIQMQPMPNVYAA